MKYPDLLNCTVAVIGMGYVGLPLAIELAKSQNCYLSNKKMNRRIIAFDVNCSRIQSLINNIDLNDQIDKNELKEAENIEYVFDANILYQADIFIITVPTPIDEACVPDLNNLKEASKTVGIALKQRLENISKSSDISPVVIFESTVYPGATEEICIPIIEAESNLVLNANENAKGFVCGYSPERINPGDKERTLVNIVKVTSGSNVTASEWINKFYGSIIKAGTFKASSIKIAEAAKVIENTQRDLNIALINELSIIFRKMKIDTLDVLEAASTKWNFLDFKPGLVGGHCIGVDPYYLTYKSKKMGYYPQVVLAGRRINDKMGAWIIEQFILEMARKSMIIGGSDILILGLTFKENCKDIRNTRVIDMVKVLYDYKINVDVVDPLIDCDFANKIYKINILNKIPNNKKYSGVILAVAHEEFVKFSKKDWENLVLDQGIFLDVKGIIPRSLSPIRI
tara:strand:- start:2464 stop:3831 length:1368 start_codon:yes stop_codon:yes gene_type:complete